MLRARNWRRALGGGETQPQVFECSDDQEWVVKLPGNPHGVSGLCADWLGTMIAALVDVPVIECSLVEVVDDALATMPRGSTARAWAQPGVAFGSRYVIDSKNVTGQDVIMGLASSLDLARIVATDTWLDVLDRRKPQGQWNLLLLTGEEDNRLVTIDYGLALGELLGPPILGRVSMDARCPEEWRPHLRGEDLDLAASAIKSVARTDLESLVSTVPSSWQSALPRWREIPAYLDTRREDLLLCLIRLVRGGRDDE